MKKFYGVNHLLLRSVTQPGGRFEPKRSICVTSFRDGDLLHPQLLRSLKGVFNNHPCSLYIKRRNVQVSAPDW